MRYAVLIERSVCRFQPGFNLATLRRPTSTGNHEMKKRLLAAALLALTLAGCIVVPARPAYYRPAPVVIY